MKSILNVLVLLTLTVFVLQYSLAGFDIEESYKGIEPVVIELNQNVEDYAEPFLIKVCPGDTIQFFAAEGQFAVFIRNADKFFENAGSTVKIGINSSGSRESELFIVRSDLPVDSEIKYEVYCISQDGWADAPPRIIIDCSE